MNWADANTWAEDLVLGGFSDWRLPTILQPDLSCGNQSSGGGATGYNCTGSEMGHLFYSDLGVAAGNPITSSTSSNYALFSNVQAGAYWSNVDEYAPAPNLAWFFYAFNGNQNHNYKYAGIYAWAVRPGDVAAVPLPGAVWLFGSGLMVLLALKRRVI
jgi:hypothetical protein